MNKPKNADSIDMQKEGGTKTKACTTTRGASYGEQDIKQKIALV